MAQALNDPQNQDDKQDHVWPISLIVNQAYAQAFACVKCKGLPTKCKNDADGAILCCKCSKDMDNIADSRAVQNLINKLKTKCLSKLNDKNDNRYQNIQETEGSNLIATPIADNDQCNWIGAVQDYNNHDKECLFVVIKCDKCKTFKCQRKLLDNHLKECGEVTIKCPLSCGVNILRKDTHNHLQNDCIEQLLDCINDDCKMQIKRKNFIKHTKEECDTRIVECEYQKYGCNVKNIKANQLKQHMNESKLQHLSYQFNFVTNKQQIENEKLMKELKNAVPIGTIVMWSGSKDDIPNGWLLCDGNNDTPDLRNKFIIGASDDCKVNSIGGNKQHNHSVTVNGHKLTVDEMPNHTHKRPSGKVRNIFLDHGYHTNFTLTDGNNRNIHCTNLDLKSTGGSQMHNHTASSSTTSSLPPYYSMCFIIKRQ